MGRKEGPLTSRVLIIDSDAALRQRLYGQLLDIDIFSDCVGSAADALEKLEGATYSLVIAGVELAERGIERIIGRIAAMGLHERPIVLVVTGSAEAARSLDVEIVQIVLRRPVNVPQIVELIASCLRSSVAPRREGHLETGAPHRRDRAV